MGRGPEENRRFEPSGQSGARRSGVELRETTEDRRRRPQVSPGGASSMTTGPSVGFPQKAPFAWAYSWA
jgi:hypothetical protein